MSQFVVRAVGGPPDLVARAPFTATTITSLPDVLGHGEYWCASLEEPIKYRLPADFDRRRCQPEFLGFDKQGPFLWTGVIVVWVSDPNRRLHPGMRDLEVQIAYVVDQTLGRDRFLDPAKIDVVAIGRIDDVDTAPPPAPVPPPPAPVRVPPAPVAVDDAPPPAAAVESPPPRVETLSDGEVEAPALGVAEFRRRLALLIAKLASLTGIHPGTDTPVEAPIGDLIAGGVTGFDLYGPDGPRYRRDSEVGWQTIATGTLEELLYRIVDDVAKMLAWRWSAATPVAADGMPDHLRTRVATAYWRLLVEALDPVWGARTTETIDRNGGIGAAAESAVTEGASS
ncbi:hypothetical protein [Mycolicibacterium arenosum]|uniref:Uncharacterized protein n=1 Tax=Mycolicibacterium arenosum TaxID=2952157 RepID=A0ABT1MDZ7_9MYCO|nr:hypothetical protein [Mycolicibacterium sp. CAU 1645]MCP9276795.1 hypothetical protein [Mycolicibacterium sp. CAU 1645]